EFLLDAIGDAAGALDAIGDAAGALDAPKSSDAPNSTDAREAGGGSCGPLDAVCANSDLPCPRTLSDAVIADLCSQRWVGGVWVGTMPCGGVVALAVDATDCETTFLFDATTKDLVEVVRGCNGGADCVGSASGVPVGPACVHDCIGNCARNEAMGGAFAFRPCSTDAGGAEAGD
ncbi:MAG TPA: hypothetical protein VGY54_14560, partial [Polyangiaceae bacterium]|nr:hypothetical protein [Polyangiaceae bacterium]